MKTTSSVYRWEAGEVLCPFAAPSMQACSVGGGGMHGRDEHLDSRAAVSNCCVTVKEDNSLLLMNIQNSEEKVGESHLIGLDWTSWFTFHFLRNTLYQHASMPAHT